MTRAKELRIKNFVYNSINFVYSKITCFWCLGDLTSTSFLLYSMFGMPIHRCTPYAHFEHKLIDILKQIIKQAGNLGMTRDWVWIITDAQTDRVSSGFSSTDLCYIYVYFSLSVIY